MQFNLKNYQSNKIKSVLKKNNLILFALGANQNSRNWMVLEQNLHKLSLSYTKIYNNAAKKLLENSIFKNLKSSINSTFFFLKPKKNTQIPVKNSTIANLNNIKFTVISLKLNKKFYTASQLQNIPSLHHKKNTALLYQFLLTNLNSSINLKIK
jgi:hypothetical protein